jgi:hypothetical protein
MRQFAFGCLRYTPEQLSKMLVCDLLDAMTGYNRSENLKFKRNAEVIRLSTTILWNIQVDKDSKLKPEELMPFSWDKAEETISEEVEYRKERDRHLEEMKNILNRLHGNGDSNNKSES